MQTIYKCMKINPQRLVSTHYNIFGNTWLKLYWIQTVGKLQLHQQVYKNKKMYCLVLHRNTESFKLRNISPANSLATFYSTSCIAFLKDN